MLYVNLLGWKQRKMISVCFTYNGSDMWSSIFARAYHSDSGQIDPLMGADWPK